MLYYGSLIARLGFPDKTEVMVSCDILEYLKGQEGMPFHWIQS